MATIVVGVTGGVAAFKAPIVVRECQRAGHDVYVAATRASLDFVGRSTWEGITSRPVAVDIAGEGRAEHVELARVADLIIIVPATANTLARLAAGFADDMVSLTVLASDAPVVVAPAMHSNMWLAAATQANVATLRERGVHVIDPESGALGSGDSGVGRLPAPEEIARRALDVLDRAGELEPAPVLAGRTVVVTAGGTREPIDPVRFLGNKSSGRQGLAVAAAAARAGASVRVIAANIDESVMAALPSGVEVTRVGSACEMREATMAQVIGADALVMTAAVADFRPEAAQASKMKKDPTKTDAPTLRLVRNPDILAEAARASVPIERVFILDNVKDDRVEEVVRLASAMGAPVYEVTRRDLDVATDGVVHQGVAIEVRGYEYADASDLIAGSLQQLGHPLLVALDQVTDPHNLGAVLRSAGAFGADGVIIPERRSAGVNTTAWKVSAGAAARVPVARATNLVRALEEAKAAGYFVVGLDGGGEAPLRGLSLADGPLVVVTGAEGAGLSRLVRETYDQIVSIPIASTVESLNAAVATGIALYEVASLRSQG